MEEVLLQISKRDGMEEEGSGGNNTVKACTLYILTHNWARLVT